MTMQYLSRNQNTRMQLNSFHLIYEDFQIYLVHSVLQYSFINDKSQAVLLMINLKRLILKSSQNK